MAIICIEETQINKIDSKQIPWNEPLLPCIWNVKKKSYYILWGSIYDAVDGNARVTHIYIATSIHTRVEEKK